MANFTPVTRVLAAPLHRRQSGAIFSSTVDHHGLLKLIFFKIKHPRALKMSDRQSDRKRASKSIEDRTWHEERRTW